MGLVTKYGFQKGWQPSEDAVNASPDALLRSDNLIFDEQGILALRPGSSKVNSSALATTDVRSLYTVDISSVKYRLAQGAGSVHASANDAAYSSIASGFDTSLDVQFSSYLGHAFMASGTVKKKYNGTLRNWGIEAPSAAPTLSQVAPSTKILVSGDSTETTWTDNESSGGGSYVAGFDGTANGARSLTASATTFRGVESRDIGTSTDYTDYGGGVSGNDNDLIEFYALVDDPNKVKSITITVDFNGTAAATYDRDYASFTWTVTAPTAVVDAVDIQAQIQNAYDIQGYAMQQAVGHIIERDTFAQVVRPEASGWQYFSAKRSEFKHVKTTNDKFWNTVRGIRISFEGSGQGTVAIDRLRMLGGVGTPLTGTYVYRAVFVREDTAYNALGVTSDASSEIIVKNQSVRLAVPNTSDSQVTHVWLYRMGGFLDAFYRVGRQAVVAYPASNYTAAWETFYFPDATEQFDFTAAWEVSYVDSSLTSYGPSNHTQSWEEDYYTDFLGYTNITDEMSDSDALILNIRLELDNLRPPDNIIGISEDYFSRIFCLTSDGKLHPSRRLNPESFASGQELRIGGPSETPYWIKKSFGGLYIGTSKDVYRVAGDGSEYPDGTVNFRIDPLNVNSPPVDSALAHDGNLLIYRAQDGPRLFQGDASSPLRGATDLLWRGYARHGVSAINNRTGRFRMAITDGVLAILIPEGSNTTTTQVIYKYNFAQQQWYRHTYGRFWRSIYREPDGTLIAGDNAGFVWHLEDNDATGDANSAIDVLVLTKNDDFGLPFKPKTAESFLSRMDTGGTSGTINFYIDGSGSYGVTSSPDQDGQSLFSKSLTQYKFRQLQWRLTGSFTTFRFYGYTIQFVEAPESVEVFDTGPLDLGTRDFSFVRMVQLKVQTSFPLTVTPYLDGVAQTPKTISPTTEQARVYDVFLGREMKASTPRFVIAAPAGSTFEPYWLRCYYRASGNMSEKKVYQVNA